MKQSSQNDKFYWNNFNFYKINGHFYKWLLVKISILWTLHPLTIKNGNFYYKNCKIYPTFSLIVRYAWAEGADWI